jgi:ribosomal protein L11 methylase PrmA
MPPVEYWRLTLPPSDEISEGLINFIWELGALGVVEDGELQAFFPPGTAAEALEQQIRGYLDGLRRLGFQAPGAPTIAPLVEEPWAEAWKQYFEPVEVGKGLVIVPPWMVAESGGAPEAQALNPRAEVRPPDRNVRAQARGVAAEGVARTMIVIEPGRAFGTGHHGSTAGCLVLLERSLARTRAERALDLGTGSGILAITAARLGVAHVLAVDEDPDAVANAASNARLNGVADRVRCALSDAATLSLPERAPLVLANLLAAAHVRLAPRYGLLLAPAGTLIVGGILDHEASAIRKAFAAAALTPSDEQSADGWVALAFTGCVSE